MMRSSAAPAGAVGALAVLAAVGLPVPLVREVGEVRQPLDGAEDDAAAVAAVAAVGAAAGDVLLAAEAHAAVAAVAPSHVDRHPVDEHRDPVAGRPDRAAASSLSSGLDGSAAVGSSGTTLIRRPLLVELDRALDQREDRPVAADRRRSCRACHLVPFWRQMMLPGLAYWPP